MPPRDLVVFIEDEPGCHSRLAYAAALAARWQAHLIATFVPDRLELHPHVDFVVGAAALTDLLTRHRERVERVVTDTRSAFEALLRKYGIDGEWRVSEREDGEALMLHARHASLALLGPPAQRRASVSALSLSEHVIFASGRPSLLLPDDWSGEHIGRRVVIGWNASREATAAIAAAMPFLRQAEQVQVVVVPEAKAPTRYGADPGVDITRHLARHGVPVVLAQHQGSDAGAALLDCCRDGSADLLVVGAAGRSRVSEFVFGGATRTLLGAIEIPLFLSR